MNAEDVIYRPPYEASSLLLPVTTGCSHNKCRFCTMYRGGPFRVLPLEETRQILLENRRWYARADRAFLENGDAFILDTDHLLKTAEMIYEIMPKIRSIGAYASVRSILSKSEQELRQLREMGFDYLNIGVESGLDQALTYMNKGFTAAQATEALLRLKDAGFHNCVNIILGIGGAAMSQAHAESSARFLNTVQPALLYVGTMHPAEGCPVYEEIRQGTFVECTNGQYIEEELSLLEQIHPENCIFFGLHPSNVVQVRGLLPRDQQAIIDYIKKQREGMKETYLNARPIRGEEGGILSRS